MALAAQTQLFDQGLVSAGIDFLQVVQQGTALGHQFQKTTAGMVVLFVGLEVFGQIGDALGQDSHLNFCASGVAFCATMFNDQVVLALGCNRHRTLVSARVHMEDAHGIELSHDHLAERDHGAAQTGRNKPGHGVDP